MTFPSNSIFFIEQRRKSSKLLVDWKNQQLKPSPTPKMHKVIEEGRKISPTLPIFLVSSLFWGFCISLKILAILEFYLPKLDLPFLSPLVLLQGWEIWGLMHPQNNGWMWKEMKNLEIHNNCYRHSTSQHEGVWWWMYNFNSNHILQMEWDSTCRRYISNAPAPTFASVSG